ncbi:Lrp/AsnC family transcriptional regulator [Clostridium sp. WILCCON 0269]|uniref:siroheme decarboxylase n=1 Tax=Candidatus Clostridium eludens TaxID=3381663 RepID=A0ABW8SME0_9CLOT
MEQKVMDLLNIIQNDFPVESRPFLTLANKLDMTEEEVIELVKGFKESGYIRRLGGVFDSSKLGYTSTLCAMEVPKDRIEEVAAIINNYSGVTHNYLRIHKYNMWFTLTAPSSQSIEDTIEEIKNSTTINDIMILTSLNTFKIKVNFNVKGV